jgi:uncharacterized protein (DUF433 family)
VTGRHVVADPRVCHGRLTFRGTRILVADVLEQVARGEPWPAIALARAALLAGEPIAARG